MYYYKVLQMSKKIKWIMEVERSKINDRKQWGSKVMINNNVKGIK